MKKKLAVFISGPKRFVPLVREQILAMECPLTPEFFIHLWTDDKSAAARADYPFDELELARQPDVRCLLLHLPYSDETYTAALGTLSNSPSAIFATMGMFLAVNQLCHVLDSLPNRDEYTHVLRIRTDCALLEPRLLSGILGNTGSLWVSENPYIHSSWVSDHLCLGPRDLFLRLWKFQNMEELYRSYIAGRRNPEKTLAVMAKKHLGRAYPLEKKFRRFRDYQIVYTKPKAGEPRWVEEAVQAGRIREIFIRPQSLPYFEDRLTTDAIIPPGIDWLAPAKAGLRKRAKLAIYRLLGIKRHKWDPEVQDAIRVRLRS